MTASQLNFDAYAFSKQPGYIEAAVRKEFAKAAPCERLSFIATIRAR